MKVERRAITIEAEATKPLLAVERRCGCEGSTDDEQWIVGYAARFGVSSLDLGDFVERIDPSAFGLVSERRGRREPLETRALFNHDQNFPLARYPSTLKLGVDDIGLRYEFRTPNTTYGRDLAANIEAGIVTGSSFSFTVAPNGEKWDIENGRSVRTITKIGRLLDVGPVTFPAYPDADVEVARRSFEHFAKESRSRQAFTAALRSKTEDLRKFLRDHGRQVG